MLNRLLIGTLWLVSTGAWSEQGRSGAELLAAADRSFSETLFGTEMPPPDFTVIDDGGCIDGMGECSYLDTNHVGHYFFKGTLVVKWIEVSDVGDLYIAALDIGKERSLEKVVEQVGRFLPEAELGCHEYPAQSGATVICDATLGDGWMRMFFDRSKRLEEVRIDAYHFT